MKELQGRRAYLKNFWYAAGGFTLFLGFLKFVPLVLSALSVSRKQFPHNSGAHAAVSEKVKEGKAHGVELCGEKLVLFRGKDGKVRHITAPESVTKALFLIGVNLYSVHLQPSCIPMFSTCLPVDNESLLMDDTNQQSCPASIWPDL